MLPFLLSILDLRHSHQNLQVLKELNIVQHIMEALPTRIREMGRIQKTVDN